LRLTGKKLPAAEPSVRTPSAFVMHLPLSGK
jgi:hypothetical protein